MENNRRGFLKMVAAGAAAAMPGLAQEPQKKEKAGNEPVQKMLPRWRGFNLLDMFTMRSRGDFREDDFRWMRDWGFDFVRLPMCYRLWIEDGEAAKSLLLPLADDGQALSRHLEGQTQLRPYQ
jgi:aryl-phospho-beta-D-glucosidase BglC (GH1 family)